MCIYVDNFVFDDDAVLWSETICPDEWVAGFPEIKISQSQLKLRLGPIHLLCLLIKANSFAFGEDAALLPDTPCLDEWVAGFPQNKGVTAPTLRCDWVRCIFGVYLLTLINAERGVQSSSF